MQGEQGRGLLLQTVSFSLNVSKIKRSNILR